MSDESSILTEKEYKLFALKACDGLENLSKDERLAVLKVRFDKAQNAYKNIPNGDNWGVLIRYMAGLQTVYTE